MDRIVSGGSTFDCGAFHVAAIDAPGNTLDGTAYVLLDQGVLLAGDFLSSVGYPFLEGAPAVARATCERLLGAIDEFQPRWVITGHGPALTPGEARSIGEADLAYLERLEQAARDAIRAELSPAEALLAAFAVEPPRSILLDFELYAPRAGNAHRAIEAESRGGPSTGWSDESGWRLFRK